MVALPNPSFQPKKSPVVPRGGGAKSGGALPKLRILCPKTALFGPKGPQNPVKTAKRRQTVAPMVQDHFWKNAFFTLFPHIFAPKTAAFQGILVFSMGRKA